MFQQHEYDAVRLATGVLAAPDRGRIAVNGSDRRTFLHALLTNDIAALGPGAGCYAALLNAQGRMLADLYVFELGNVILLDVPLSRKDDLLARFDELVFSEDVQVGDLTETFSLVSVQGATAAAVLQHALAAVGVGLVPGEGLESWAPCQNRRATAGEDLLVVARVDDFGWPGFHVYSAPAVCARLETALLGLGAVAVSHDTAEVFRIEAGRPAFPADMNEDAIPLEAGIEARAISQTKGCYPGQEVVIRILHRGHGRVLRKLMGLVVGGNQVPAPGDTLEAGGKAVGSVTSTCHSPFLGQPIALAYVHRECLAPGTQVEILHGDVRLTAAVQALPFTA
jgi:folate-binding protein YgfZ